MQCTVCRSTFRLTAYNRSSTCHMCQAQQPQDKAFDEEVELELNLMKTKGRTMPVFDSDSTVSDYGGDYEDYGHGLQAGAYTVMVFSGYSTSGESVV